MALDPLIGITTTALQAAHNDALVALDKESKTPEQNWYPCGFAWACIAIRKNHRLAKTLIGFGFRWSDYEKQYQFSMPRGMYKFSGMSQSMDYADRCLQAYAQVMRDNGIPCYVRTRID